MDNDILSYQAHDVGDLYEALPDAFDVNPDASQAERFALFRQASIQGGLAGPLTLDEVIQRAESKPRRDLAVPERRFTLG